MKNRLFPKGCPVWGGGYFKANWMLLCRADVRNEICTS